jgi:hypothetical protein
VSHCQQLPPNTPSTAGELRKEYTKDTGHSNPQMSTLVKELRKTSVREHKTEENGQVHNNNGLILLVNGII